MNTRSGLINDLIKVYDRVPSPDRSRVTAEDTVITKPHNAVGAKPYAHYANELPDGLLPVLTAPATYTCRGPGVCAAICDQHSNCALRNAKELSI